MGVALWKHVSRRWVVGAEDGLWVQKRRRGRARSCARRPLQCYVPSLLRPEDVARRAASWVSVASRAFFFVDVLHPIPCAFFTSTFAPCLPP